MNTLKKLVLTTVALLACQLAVADHHRVDQMRELLSDPSRPEADKARDAGRKPAEVIEFTGIAPGMKVLDLIASSGYYTEVLSKAVGDNGTVYCQNNPGYLDLRGGGGRKALEARLAEGRLANVMSMEVAIKDLDIEPGSLDAATLVLNFHDIYNNSAETAVNALQLIASFLKPEGFIVIIDHVGHAGNDNAKLHRIEPEKVRQAIADAGLMITAESGLLAGTADDHSKMVFAPGIRGNTERFLFKVGKKSG